MISHHLELLWKEAVKAAVLACKSATDTNLAETAFPFWQTFIHDVLVTTKLCPCMTDQPRSCLTRQSKEWQLEQIADILPEMAFSEFCETVRTARDAFQTHVH